MRLSAQVARMGRAMVSRKGSLCIALIVTMPAAHLWLFVQVCSLPDTGDLSFD